MILAIGNQKGGAAKTTTAMNLGAALTLFGKRVLCIDLDRQATMTKLLGHTRVAADVFDAELEPLRTRVERLDLLPAGPSLRTKATYYDHRTEYGRLKERLDAYQRGYDFLVLDCPPDTYGVTRNALVAADLILIPSRVNSDVLEVTETWDDLGELRSFGLPVTERVAALGTQFERTAEQRQMVVYAQNKYSFWLQSVIRKSRIYDRANLNGKWIPAALLGNRGSAPRKDHVALAQELGLV